MKFPQEVVDGIFEGGVFEGGVFEAETAKTAKTTQTTQTTKTVATTRTQFDPAEPPFIAMSKEKIDCVSSIHTGLFFLFGLVYIVHLPRKCH